MSHEHVSNIGRIWKVFGILSAVTIVEVYLGIVKPDFLFMNDFLGMNILNWVALYSFDWRGLYLWGV